MSQPADAQGPTSASVDWPQARKEEMWELAKAEGARGDTQSDTHYVKNVAGW